MYDYRKLIPAAHAMSARKNIFSLPPEILHIVVEILPRSDQHALSFVSRFFHLITIRPLYTRISAQGAPQVVRCCRTLAANKDLAEVVKSFHFRYKWKNAEQNYLSSFYATLQNGLKSLTNLKQIRMTTRDAYCSTALRDATLPHLSRVETYFTADTFMIEFLNRHPEVEVLELSAYSPFHLDYSIPRTISLPKLRFYAGNASCLESFTPTMSLKAAFLSWEYLADNSPWSALRVLEKTSSDTLNLVSCRRNSGWNLDLVEALSICVPDISWLTISHIMLLPTQMTPEYIETMKLHLSKFTRLQRLFMDCITQWYDEKPTCSMDDDFATVTAWGYACPNLHDISLPHSNDLSWFRVSEHVWIPDPRRDEGTKWLASKIHNKPDSSETRFEPVVNYFKKSLTGKQIREDDDYDGILRAEFMRASEEMRLDCVW